MKSFRDEISLKHDCQYLISFTLKIGVLLSENNVSCQASILCATSSVCKPNYALGGFSIQGQCLANRNQEDISKDFKCGAGTTATDALAGTAPSSEGRK
jgi:hypothetical protein